MTLAEATRCYQNLLEGHRALLHDDPHHILADVEREVAQARAAMETAWLKHTTTTETGPMYTRHLPVTTPDDALRFLRVYAAWPAWRRWIWRNLGR